MRLRVDLIPELSRDDNDYTGSQSPWFWYGVQVLVGDHSAWAAAPLASKYWCIMPGSIAEYLKIADNKTNADWMRTLGPDDLTPYLLHDATIDGGSFV